MGRFKTAAWRASALSAALAIVLAHTVSAYALTGSITDGSHSGSFVWQSGECYNGWCAWQGYTWTSTSTGSNAWAATYQSRLNQYQIAPFQQDALLANGKQMWADGVWPIAGTSSNIYDPYGHSVLSNYHAPAGTCYTTAYDSNSLYWGWCSTSGFAIGTASYPPGTDNASYSIASGDANVLGIFYNTYGGSLR